MSESTSRIIDGSGRIEKEAAHPSAREALRFLAHEKGVADDAEIGPLSARSLRAVGQSIHDLVVLVRAQKAQIARLQEFGREDCRHPKRDQYECEYERAEYANGGNFYCAKCWSKHVAETLAQDVVQYA